MKVRHKAVWSHKSGVERGVWWSDMCQDRFVYEEVVDLSVVAVGNLRNRAIRRSTSISAVTVLIDVIFIVYF